MAAAGGGQSRTSAWLRNHGWDLVALAGLLVAFFVVHDVRRWLDAPYWLDETWVALSTRVPLGDLPTITSTTPIGWTVLLRIVPDPAALRVVPLAFALLAVIAAYLFGRNLGWRNRFEAAVGGGLAASAVVLLPAAQERHDLKQYTADAALALALLALAGWADRASQRRGLIVLAAAGPLAFLFSPASALVTAAAFGGVAVAAAVRRDWRGVAWRLGAGVVSGAALGGLYLLLVAPVQVPSLAAFWRRAYPEPAELPRYLVDAGRTLAPSLGFSPLIGAVAVMLGVVAIALLRRWATLAAVLLLPVVVLVLGLLKLYPLLDARTSYFLVVVAAALTGIGVARVATGVASWLGTAVARRALRSPVLEPVVAVLLALAAAGTFAVANRPWYRYDGPTPVSVSDVRTQTQWVDAHRRPGDVVILSHYARLGYFYYHDSGPMQWYPTGEFAHGWDVILPADPDVIALDAGAELIGPAVQEAVQRARRSGPDARVFVIRTWWAPYEEGVWEAWQTALAPYTVTHPYDGVEAVTVIDDLGSAA